MQKYGCMTLLHSNLAMSKDKQLQSSQGWGVTSLPLEGGLVYLYIEEQIPLPVFL